MKVSELIAELEALMSTHGDLPVYVCSYTGTESVCAVEHCDAEKDRKKRFINDTLMPEMLIIQG